MPIPRLDLRWSRGPPRLVPAALPYITAKDCAMNLAPSTGPPAAPGLDPPGIRRAWLLATGLLAFALLPAAAGAAGRPSGSGATPPAKQHGRLLPVLPDGTPVEPSTDRAEFTESADVLEEGRWDWNVDLVGGATNRIGTLEASSLDYMHAELRRGLGNGLEFGARAESWTRTVADQGDLGQTLDESGYGRTVLTLRQRLAAGDSTRPAVAIGARVQLPGAASGPGTHEVEGGLFLPVSFPLGEDTRLGAMAEADLVSNVFDTGRHLEGASSIELSHDFGERVSARCEAVSVWYGETGRPWLGTLNAGISVDALPHVGVTLGGSGGWSAGTGQAGWYGRLSVHS